MKNFILINFCLFLSLTCISQNLEDRTKTRAENKANQRVDQKIDNALDDGFDAIEGLFSGKNKKKKKTEPETPTVQDNTEVSNETENRGVGMAGLFGSSEPLRETYEFDKLVKMKLTTTDKKDDQVMYMDMRFSSNEPIIAMDNIQVEGEEEQQADATMILDMEQRQMLTLTNVNGTKMAMTLNMDAAKVDAEDEEDNITFKKSGNTKEILGYTCEEYLFNSEEATGNFWVTDEVDLKMDDAFFMMGKDKKGYRPTDYPEGFFMEMNTQTKDGKSTSKMEVTAFDADADYTISTIGYKQFGLGK